MQMSTKITSTNKHKRTQIIQLQAILSFQPHTETRTQTNNHTNEFNLCWKCILRSPRSLHDSPPAHCWIDELRMFRCSLSHSIIFIMNLDWTLILTPTLRDFVSVKFEYSISRKFGALCLLVCALFQSVNNSTNVLCMHVTPIARRVMAEQFVTQIQHRNRYKETVSTATRCHVSVPQCTGLRMQIEIMLQLSYHIRFNLCVM